MALYALQDDHIKITKICCLNEKSTTVIVKKFQSSVTSKYT